MKRKTGVSGDERPTNLASDGGLALGFKTLTRLAGVPTRSKRRSFPLGCKNKINMLTFLTCD